MKKLPIINTILILLCVIYVGLNSRNKTSQGIAYINTAKLMQEFQGMQEVHKTMDLMKLQNQSTLDSLSRNLENKIKAFEQNSNSYSKDRLRKERTNLEFEQRQLHQYHESVSKKLAEKEQDLTKLAIMPVDALIKEYGKEKGLTIILSALPSGNIVYAEDYIDVTNDIIELANNIEH